MTSAKPRQLTVFKLIDTLQLQQLGDNTFQGEVLHTAMPRIFGGEVLAQSQAATRLSVDSGYQLHSMHGYFLTPGDVNQSIHYAVEELHDGKSFATRRLTASQSGSVIFVSTMSFQRAEEGMNHQQEMPSVIAAQELPSEEERTKSIFEKYGASFIWPIELREVEPVDLMDPQVAPPRSQVWMRSRAALPDDPALHQQLFAYASDSNMIGTCLRPYGVGPMTPNMQVASLDHAIWYHRAFRMDEWLLYDLQIEANAGGRGLVSGRLFTEAGVMVASTRQEGLIRQRKS